MKNIFLQSIRFLLLITLVTGVFYPLAVSLIGQGIFRAKANGSIVELKGVAIGSELLAQKFSSMDSFWPRPSSSDYQTLPSGASNLGPTSQKLNDRIHETLKNYSEGDKVPYELLLMSGSGLDPHISPESAKFQVKRVSANGGYATGELIKLIDELTESPSFRILGRARVNVLKLNLALKELRK